MNDSALLTDLEQLNMLQAYFDQQMNEEAVFEFMVRKLPARGNFLLAGGLAQVVDFLETLHFSDKELAWLAACGHFHKDFVRSLADLRFTGTLEAMAEGTVFFPEEPILRITAPLREAQLIESRLINLLQFQTLVASKAARARLTAPNKQLIDAGLRWAHGAEAALLAARATFLAGFDGTSNVLAAVCWDIPLFGGMSDSFIQTHDDDSSAFLHFAHSHPGAATLLIDTRDPEAAVQALIPLVKKLAMEGIAIQAVGIDSRHPGEDARQVRNCLDAGGLSVIQIFASNHLDENVLQTLNASGAPINGYYIGSRIDTAADLPCLDCTYTLQEYAGQPSRQQGNWPGRKQVFRRFAAGALQTELAGDTLCLAGEEMEGVALLQPVIRTGQRVAPLPDLQESRRHAQAQLATLPPALRRLECRQAPAASLEVSAALQALAQQLAPGRTGSH